MKVVSRVSQLNESNPMKISFAKLFALLLIVCTPMVMLGKRAREFSSPTIEINTVSARSIDPATIINKTVLLYTELGLGETGISFEAFTLALKGFDKLTKKGLLNTDSILTIVDFSKSSRQKRLAVIDLKSNTLEYSTVVAHGRNTGAEYARSFSNQPRSNKSSLGFYVTQETYIGAHGLSLKLDGFEKGINDKARERAIVMHGAAYADERTISSKGYLGRSFGCPALPTHLTQKIIQKIKNGNCLFVYYPDRKYLKSSEILNG